MVEEKAPEKVAEDEAKRGPESQAEEPKDELGKVKEELEAEKEISRDYRDRWLRARADFANYKRRNEQEQQELIKFGTAALIAQLLPVLDDFERAMVTIPLDLLGFSWLQGVRLIQRKLEAILEQQGMKAMEVVGKPFDPISHEAVLYEESEKYEDGQVIAELQKGYTLHDRILRPALVKVAKAAAKPSEEGQSDVAKEEN